MPLDEDQLTEMLFWLISVEPAVGAALVKLALGDAALASVDIHELETQTQVPVPDGCIDGVLSAPGFRIVVESKLESGFHSNQLTKYLNWLAGWRSAEDVTRRVLMSLTKHEQPWPEPDRLRADELEIEMRERRWSELYAALVPLRDDPERDDLPRRLISEFLEMLMSENLMPTPPLSEQELGKAWLPARDQIKRFHQFFFSCVTCSPPVLTG